MKRAIPGLLLALLIQLLLVTIMYRGELMSRQPAASPGLSVLDPNQIDALDIHDGDGTRARLNKVGGRWRLPALHGLPADPEKVDKLLKALLVTGNDWPVASSTAARQRFKVAEYRFRLRIEFFVGGEKRQVIYLGTSPGFRKVHARVAGQDEIRSVAFNVHDAPASDSAWIDPRLLQVRTPVRIDADAYTVRREGDEWRSGTGNVPDQRELLALLSALRSLRVEGVADTATVTDLADLEAELVLDIHSLSGRIELSLFQLAGRHFIRSSEFPVIFRISAYDFDRITGLDFLLMSGEGDDGDRS